MRSKQLKASMVKVYCKCGQEIMLYRKEGGGMLRYCALNKIFGPEEIRNLYDDPYITNPDNIPLLMCKGCHMVVGVPVRHRDQIAFKLRHQHYSVKGDD